VSEPLAVLRVGMCYPVGLDAAQTVAAIRAGITRKSETPMLDFDGHPVIVGHLADELLPRSSLGPHSRACSNPLDVRMLRLATRPLRELLTEHFAGAALPIYLAASEPFEDAPATISDHFLLALAEQTEVAIDLPSSRIFPLGAAGFFTALAAARDELLIPGRAEFVIVGGVDTYYDPARLEALELDGRLRTSGPQDAFTPGEGAAFVIVTTASTCRRHNLSPLAWITSVGLAHDSEQRLPVEGLAAACSAALADPDGTAEPVRLVMAGLNGESPPAKEWGVAYLRTRERFAEPLRIEHPAEYIGYPGAALGPLMLGTAALFLRGRTAVGPALIWACSDSGQRGALLLCAGG
jgi:3-oxoacyl-[acyl-carrier-protein] synthase-1